MYGMGMTTQTKTTLHELAREVNSLIKWQPDTRNPRNGSSCMYYDPETDSRCIIGQALFNLTGWNVPDEFEDQSIESLLGYSNFCSFFGLEVDDQALAEALMNTQAIADGGFPWGTLNKIEVDA